jgi:hypothetical protein
MGGGPLMAPDGGRRDNQSEDHRQRLILRTVAGKPVVCLNIEMIDFLELILGGFELHY